jgi:hypothetical protein
MKNVWRYTTCPPPHVFMVYWRTGYRKYLPKEGKMIGGWRKLHTEELLSVYFAADVIGMIK